ncbi:MAG: AAA family ATPase, partial [Candidatus Binatia bacterium]
MVYRPRKLEPIIRDLLGAFPVVGLTGPRQSGKSTLLQHLLARKYTYVTFDDFRMVALFEDDPEKFMDLYSNRVIFDEVQKVPALFNYIKLAVDRDRHSYGKFVLTGSSQF